MSEPVLSGTASAHSLTKDPSEFKRRTYQDILEKDSKLGGAFPETNEKVALENGDREKSHRESMRKTTNRRLLYDLTLLSCILIMLLWPWIFLGIVYAKKGIQMDNHLAKVVINHPHSTNFSVTLIASVVCMFVDILFSFAVIRFAQEWIANNEKITVFDVSVISGLRHQTLPWNIKDIKKLLVSNRVVPVFLVGICIGAFALIPSAVTSLLTPVPFKKNSTLQGVELDLSSSDCFDWLATHPISNNCDWGIFNGLPYITCSPVAATLDAGRGNLFSLISNNSQTISYDEIGGVRFFRSIRGILPIGPNGVPINALKPSPFSNKDTIEGMISYNYTLEHQGLASRINCSYVDSSPIKFGPVPGVAVDAPWVLQYNGSCDGAADILTNVKTFVIFNANGTLAYWACQSPPAAEQTPTYFIYLRGRVYYKDSIGNITCTVSQVQPAAITATYQSLSNVFSSTTPIANSTRVYPRLMEYTLTALGGLIHEGQGVQSNLVAEAITEVASKTFGLPPYERSLKSLELYQAFIQGVIEYEATYLRFLWSTIENRPTFCDRTVDGSVSYIVLGWSAVPAQVGFLLPMTFLNFSALVIIIMAIVMGRGDNHEYDPASIKFLLTTQVDETDELDWTDTVRYRRGEYQAAAVDAGL